ncbi:beta-1,3-galactosyltransferase brn-like isoform X1 [Nymphalis io]|uniref:beta-1,3-galactosyltransferase brn-like isoform X1 n=1 Tax=Inachis io TaxID=171585 RepID=UPI002166E0A3|nr:beta-1,3-galactosyltransferase brn-like isoform X1 [Nymphalis io]
MRRRKYYQFIVVASVLIYVYYFFGVCDYMNTKSFDKDFHYPLDVNIQPLISNVLVNKMPEHPPINVYPYKFLSNSVKCLTQERLDLFIVVKSAMGNFEQRNGIRQTYGQEKLITGKIVRILFFIGIDDQVKSPMQKRIEEEMAIFNDVIQMDFHDSYFNNTIKTMMSFRWLFDHCSNANNYLFTDDDMYISVKNLLTYVENEAPENVITRQGSKGDRDSVILHDGSQKIIFAGYVFNSSPQRFRSSKWHVSLEEYPWNQWPPYVTAGAFVVSNRAMKIFYAGSLFVKHFRFDDIYLGILAKKIGLEPTHCSKFYFYKKKYSVEGYRDVIASHGYDDPQELYKVWSEQYSL